MVDELVVGVQPTSLVLDANDKLWTITDGGYEGSPYGYDVPALYRIDAASFRLEKQFRFREGDAPSEVQLNGTRDTLYWINKDVWRMPVAAEQLPARPFLEYRETKYYGLTVDPDNGDVYVADAIDYQQQGIVYRYTADGDAVDEFTRALPRAPSAGNDNPTNTRSNEETPNPAVQHRPLVERRRPGQGAVGRRVVE